MPTQATTTTTSSQQYSSSSRQQAPQQQGRAEPTPTPVGSAPAPPVAPPVQQEILDGMALQRLQNIARSESTHSHSLDTAEVSQKIREILSTHNIGQRLFAKHVLGLSQGTVSELLSKPKHWDKLTEKGRESYRKMYAWLSDEQNIMALKALSPKKGKTCKCYISSLLY